MNSTEKAVKHLEMIQAIINRLGNNSFRVKGASLAIIITAGVLTPRGLNVLPYVLSLTVLIPIILVLDVRRLLFMAGTTVSTGL